MNSTQQLICGLVAGVSLSACATTSAQFSWQASQRIDEFDDTRVCQVLHGTPSQRTAMRYATRAGITLHFYAENRDEEVRAGVMTEPAIPISGDVQIRVDDRSAIRLGLEDAPIDEVATQSAGLAGVQQRAFETTMNVINQTSSHYRALQGEEARELLRQIVSADRVIFRMVGTNRALSATGEFAPDASFLDALTACGIDLNEGV
ncbi:MAG: hypothetical protein GC188_07890 [Alphaproteobacteria bacterium]|nr:hypothetical protein [Alphaproteobacteria bacterium]